MTAANISLYGVCQSIICALGMSPGLGFVHTGHDKSFVYDIADLYKAEITIPTAFQIASSVQETDDVAKLARFAVRDKIKDEKLLIKIVKDLQYLMKVDEDEEMYIETIELWDDKDENVKHGISYKEV